MPNTPDSPSPRSESVACYSWGGAPANAPAGLHRMAWTEWGDAKNPRALICVHGLTRSGRDFDALARALSNDYRVVCPDIAGRGKSDWLESKQYLVSQYVSDCVTMIARLGVEQVDWLGTSMGGLIGMSLAALEKNPIRRLVLNDVGPLLNGAALARIGDYVGRKTRFENEAEGLAYLKTIHASFGPHTEEEWRELNRAILVPAEDGKGVRLHYDPRIGDAFRTLDEPEVKAARTPQIDPEKLWSGYDKIRAKTLVIRGAESDLITAEAHAEMGARGPKATLVTLPGIGHAPTLVHADQIDLVRQFLQQ